MQNNLSNVRKHIEKSRRYQAAGIKEGAIKELRKANDMLDECAKKALAHLKRAQESESLDEKIEIIYKQGLLVDECIRIGQELYGRIDEVTKWQP